MVLGAAERLHALAVRGAGLVDVAGDRGRADEADRRDPGVLEDRVDRHAVAVDDAEHAVGQPGLGQQLGQAHAGGGVLLGRLEDEGVAARERDRRHPQRDHHGEVERRDAGHDAERHPHAVRVDAAGHLRRVLALEQVAEPAGELDHLEPARDLAASVVEHLAVLARDQRGQLVLVRGDQLAEARTSPAPGASATWRPSRAPPRWPPRPRGRRRRPWRTGRARPPRRWRDRSPRRDARRRARRAGRRSSGSAGSSLAVVLMAGILSRVSALQQRRSVASLADSRRTVALGRERQLPLGREAGEPAEPVFLIASCPGVV